MFCARDWLHPKAGRVEYYVHEVFSRIAGQGNYVVWVSTGFRFPASRGKRPPQLEIVDGIQIARLGSPLVYRMMAGLFVSRLQRTGSTAGPFDAVVDCITGSPLPLAERTDAPVVPLVFDLNQKIRAADDPPGPLIATSNAVRRRLDKAGVPDRFIVQAPYGVDPGFYTPGEQKAAAPTLVAADDSPACLLHAVSLVRRKGLPLTAEILGKKRAPRKHAWATCLPNASPLQRLLALRRAQYGCCGAGREYEALTMATAGVPAVCPATEAGKEYVEDGRTGLLFTPGDHRELADRLSRIAQDEVLYKRLRTQAREHAEAQSWDKTAGLVLATIETMPQKG